MKRRYKLPILLVGWWFAGIFVVPQINWPMPPSGQSPVLGVLKALLLIAGMIGSVIWVIWPPKNSN
jgi:hypothetical protein